jgi:hypothetical protein
MRSLYGHTLSASSARLEGQLELTRHVSDRTAEAVADELRMPEPILQISTHLLVCPREVTVVEQGMQQLIAAEGTETAAMHV